MMDELLKKMKDYSRFLELEDNIPYWESQIPELEDRIEELKWNRQQKELEMLQLKEPNFFQRLFGRAEEKKELLAKQIREITAGIGTVRFARAFGELCLEPHRMRPARGRTESGYGRIAMQGVPGLHRTDDRMFLRLSDGGKP